MIVRKKITVSMWVHSHNETGEPLGWEIFDVTGKEMPTEMLDYLLREAHLKEDLDIFKGLCVETCHAVEIIMEYAEDCGWYIKQVAPDGD